MFSVSHLGHTFSSCGMSPDPEKTQAVPEWPTPYNVRDLGLASYYRHYIKNFASIAAPLHQLTQKAVSFSWNQACEDKFATLKCCLLELPVLIFPKFSSTAEPFVLQTVASTMGLGAVLEQGERVITYASRALTKAEKSYNVIQLEYLAIIYDLKQFQHYLQGRHFTLQKGHAPLKWLAS